MTLSRFLLAAAAGLAPAVVVIVGPALAILQKNFRLFEYSFDAARPIFAVAFVVWVIVGWALVSGARWSRAAGFGAVALAVLWPIYFTIAGAAPDLGLAVFVTILAVSVFAGWQLAKTGARKTLQTAAFIGGALVLSTAFAPIQWLMSDAAITSATSTAAPNGRPNVYHIIFDEYQSDFLNQDLARLGDTLDGFRFYPNATTAYGHTEMALGSIFSGKRIDAARQSAPQYIWEAFFDPNHSLVQAMAAAGYHTEGYPFHIYQGGTRSPYIETNMQVAKEEAPKGLSSLLSYMWVYAQLPKQVSSALTPPHIAQGLAAASLLPAQIPVASRDTLRDFIRNEHLRSSTGRYVVMHLILPHWPHVMDADCNLMADTTKPNTIGQNQCAGTLMRELVQELKRLGRFDASMILFHSDHGAGFAFNGSNFVWTGDVGMGEALASWRSRAALVYKPMGVSDGGTLKTVPTNVTILDVAPTILAAAGIPALPGMEGRDLGTAPASLDIRYYDNYTIHPDFVVDKDLLRFTIVNGKATFTERIPVIQQPPP